MKKSEDQQILPPPTVNTPTPAGAFMPYGQALASALKQNNSAIKCSADNDGGASSSVEVISDEGFISKILVTCKCGEVIEIECDYTKL